MSNVLDGILGWHVPDLEYVFCPMHKSTGHKSLPLRIRCSNFENKSRTLPGLRRLEFVLNLSKPSKNLHTEMKLRKNYEGSNDIFLYICW